MSTQVIAVDWSGKAKGASEHVWLAAVRDGQIAHLSNGRSRDETVRQVIDLCEAMPRTVVGFDFAFSFPEWFLDERGWRTGRDVWDAMRDEAEEILAACPSPFWGRPQKRNEHGREPARLTEKETASTPKSVFQIGGAGAVGTGSLRGMPHLATLADAGFSIWPFDPDGWPRVVEIYPRLLTKQVVKSRHSDRLEYVERELPEQPDRMRERAASSEDAFDAAVSAVVMARHIDDLESLQQAPSDSAQRREGRIWAPPRT